LRNCERKVLINGLLAGEVVLSLPHFRKTVRIKFWSLRNDLGQNLGVILDVDKQVERDVYRVKTESGWKWQIKGFNQLLNYDGFVDTDQDILDEEGEGLEFEYIGVEANRQAQQNNPQVGRCETKT